MDVNLSGKFILITGGTGALGRVFVKRALEEGAQIFFTYHRNKEEAQKLEALGAKGFQVDLSKRAEIDQLKKDIRPLTRSLDAIVCNAAIVRDHAIQNLTEEEWDEVLSVNLDSVYYLIKRFLSFLFKKSNKSVIPAEAGIQDHGSPTLSEMSDKLIPKSAPRIGASVKAHAALPQCCSAAFGDDSPRKILTIVSRVGLHGGFGVANYAAAKGGLIAITKSVAQELGRKQILVNALNPGFMNSQMTESAPKEVFDRNVSESVLGTTSDPEAVSNFMIYLLSDHVRSVSGQIFHFDSRKT